MIAIEVNGTRHEVDVARETRLTAVLRDGLGLTGTKVGCDAGDCGACTVLLDGAQVCACLVPAGQADGRAVTTVEGLGREPGFAALQRAFVAHGAAQCGICTPGMLMAAADLIARDPQPDADRVKDALGGVLCRCTGYLKIVEAVVDWRSFLDDDPRPANGAGAVAASSAAASGGAARGGVGARLPKVDGPRKVDGRELFGADAAPVGCLTLRVVRSPHPHARFAFGDLAAFRRTHPAVRVLTAADVPGNNRFGVFAVHRDQPVLADGYVRLRGEAVAALVGPAEAVARVRDDALPIAWTVLPPVSGIDAALRDDAPLLHERAPGNVLIAGRQVTGDAEAALAACAHVAEGAFETGFVEHAYIEPEAGWAVRRGDRIEIFVTTQTPYMDRDEIAWILGIAPDRVRIVPSAVGGGFGGKIDMSVQPLIAVAAWVLGHPVRCVYTRPESMASTTKRHPARMHARLGCDEAGRLRAISFHADFNTGPYASCGPIVANRVPIHAMGPYRVPAVRCTTRAIYTTDAIGGAFRGFGVPQAAIVHEALIDELADRVGIDRLEFRLQNALAVGDATATGQVLEASVGMRECLEALRPRWRAALDDCRTFNESRTRHRRGVGLGCMWYGIGNTSQPNPSRMRVGLTRAGRVVLFSGAVDIGQGVNTILVQICADALGVAASDIDLVTGDTDRTLDAGKSSASRQTFISGNAAKQAADELRTKLARLANVGERAEIVLRPGVVVLRDGATERRIGLAELPAEENDLVFVGHGRFDPPTTDLDDHDRGVPYASYAFAAQLAAVEVDTALGTVSVREIVAAHDVGRAVNPTQVEGQIHGGIAQGLGLALMEEFVPGRTENLHDYLIPTFGDMPRIDIVLVESPEPLGPFGAKGIGEPALVPTAPAILNAIHHATGVRIRRVPATPDRVWAALAGEVCG
ncbi:MAG: molybdopterin-dependent oxidoreductase [Rhodovulum sp.]|nr:molybdopterin-dependent oxidoreductase [Rhodovulum sp.]